jgi:hypothetical protein
MTKPISPLRQRMIDDMTMRNLSANFGVVPFWDGGAGGCERVGGFER